MVASWPNCPVKIMAVIRKKIVPMAAFQIKAKTRREIKEYPKIPGERAKKAPMKVPIPRPPANFKKQLQLCPVTAATPQRA